MQHTQIRQGDQYPVSFKITQTDGTIITNDPTVVSNVSITIGNKTKKWNGGQGELVYDSNRKVWQYYLSQAETLNLSASRYECLIRVKFVDNNIVSVTTVPISIVDTIDRSTL